MTQRSALRRCRFCPARRLPRGSLRNCCNAWSVAAQLSGPAGVTVDEWLRERTKGLAHSGRRCYRTCQSRRAPHQPPGLCQQLFSPAVDRGEWPQVHRRRQAKCGRRKRRTRLAGEVYREALRRPGARVSAGETHSGTGDRVGRSNRTDVGTAWQVLPVAAGEPANVVDTDRLNIQLVAVLYDRRDARIAPRQRSWQSMLMPPTGN